MEDKEFVFVFLDSYNNVIAKRSPLASMHGACANIPKGAMTVAMQEVEPFYNDVLYMGCWSSVGHHLYDSTGKKHRLENHPLGVRLDGAFVPDRAKSGPEGKVKMEYVTGDNTKQFTVFGFRDNSVDKRPGSHSTFVMLGVFSYIEALAKAREKFSFVFERIEGRGIEIVS